MTKKFNKFVLLKLSYKTNVSNLTHLQGEMVNFFPQSESVNISLIHLLLINASKQVKLNDCDRME